MALSQRVGRRGATAARHGRHRRASSRRPFSRCSSCPPSTASSAARRRRRELRAPDPHRSDLDSPPQGFAAPSGGNSEDSSPSRHAAGVSALSHGAVDPARGGPALDGAGPCSPDQRSANGSTARERLAIRPGRHPDGRCGRGVDGRQLAGRDVASHLERERRRDHQRHRALQTWARLVSPRLRRADHRGTALARVRGRQHRRRRVAQRQEARPAQGGLHRLPFRRHGRPPAHGQRPRREDGQQRTEDRRRRHGHRPAQRRLQHVRWSLPDGDTRLDEARRAPGARRLRWSRGVRTHRGHRHACRRERPCHGGQ